MKTPMHTIQLMSHRGLPWSLPENSLTSIKKALDLGADVIEFDVRLTKDLIPIIMHDATIDRTTDGIGEVASYNFQDLQKFKITYTKTGTVDKGEPIPSLDELISLLSKYPKVTINCEIKEYQDICLDLVFKTFKTNNLLRRTVFTCFDYGVLEKLKAMSDEVMVQGFPLELMTNVPDGIGSPEQLFDYIGIKHSLATKELVSYYKSIGLITGVWVVNDTQQLSSCIAMGAEIITTDRIDIFIQARKKYYFSLKEDTYDSQ